MTRSCGLANSWALISHNAPRTQQLQPPATTQVQSVWLVNQKIAEAVHSTHLKLYDAPSAHVMVHRGSAGLVFTAPCETRQAPERSYRTTSRAAGAAGSMV